MQWHLAAFESKPPAIARAGPLSFMASARGFAFARTVPTSYAFTAFARALGGPQIMQFHNKYTFAIR
jgi:hypothetical protein